MKRNFTFIDFRFHFLLLICAFWIIGLKAQTNPDRPNIVWLVTEDNSKHHLRLYEATGAPMPSIEALAEQGVIFNYAFSNAPVCSVARSTIISGCYAPRVGAQFHRRMELAPMPEGLEMFPYYLREAGYFASNNSKEDYNFIKSDQVWDESSQEANYQNRKPGQPFFHVQNFGITHEGQLHFSQEEMRTTATLTIPDSVSPFPYHPNSATYRYTYARYHDLHQKADIAMGQFIGQLEQEGVMDDTFIFYYGDHGGVLPRSKGYIYESGLHVPLVVYVPANWKHLVPVEPGGRTDAFIQFIDLAPTVLSLAGIPIPKQMDGTAFLGKDITAEDLQQRNSAFSYADRFDEKYDLVRAFRKGKYKYIRNYQPFNIDGLFNSYRYKMLAYREWRDLFMVGKLDELQQQFFRSRRPEALYDLEADPHEVNNLVDHPAQKTILKALRSELQQLVKSMPDLSFYPESYFLENGLGNPAQFGQLHKTDIAGLVDIADLSLLSFAKAKKGIKKALKSPDPWKRYWGLIVCSTFAEQAAFFYEEAGLIASTDQENLVRIRAFEFLALNDQLIENKMILDIVKKAKSESEANLILNTVALLKMVKSDFRMNLPKDLFDADWMKSTQSVVSRRIEFINGNGQ